MKVWGWILLVLGVLNIIISLIAAANGASAGGAGLAFCVLGGYLLHRAKQKEEEKNEHDDWNKS